MNSKELALSLLSNLDPEQQAAVTASIGPVRVVAGAGTGKTRTLIHRIAYWHHMGAAPANTVLAVTFTRKSAAELRHRLSAMGIRGVTAQTFHSAALGQLREFWTVGGQTSDFPILLTGREEYFAIRKAISQSLKRSHDTKQPQRKVDALLQRNFKEELTRIRSKMLDMEEYLESDEFSGPKGPISKAEFVKAVQTYEVMKKSNNWIDYADCLIRCARMIENVPHVANLIRSKYQHILVDEYQDNDPVQERLLEAWLGGRRSICVVGDPRQTIFSFKGAEPKIMRDFPKKYPGAVTVELTRNYRSTRNIVEWANRMMRDTTASGGAKSDLVATGNRGWNPQVRSYYTEKVELDQTSLRIKQKCEREKMPFSQVAVLLRFRDDIPKVRRALSVLGIPSVSPKDEFWSDVDPVIRHMKRSANNLQVLGKPALMEALRSLGWINQAEDVDTEESDYFELGQSLLAVTESISGVDTMSTAELLSAYERIEDEGNDGRDSDAVNVMTIHQSKGLEWDSVFIPRFVEGVLPTTHAKTPEQIDEERRLVYVAITRARKFLELSWGETCRFMDRLGSEKSRSQIVSTFEQYLKEVPVIEPKKSDPKTSSWNERFRPPKRKLVSPRSSSRRPVPTEPLTEYEVKSGTSETVGSVITHQVLGQGKIVAVALSYSIVDFGEQGRFKIELPPY